MLEGLSTLISSRLRTCSKSSNLKKWRSPKIRVWATAWWSSSTNYRIHRNQQKTHTKQISINAATGPINQPLNKGTYKKLSYPKDWEKAFNLAKTTSFPKRWKSRTRTDPTRMSCNRCYPQKTNLLSRNFQKGTNSRRRGSLRQRTREGKLWWERARKTSRMRSWGSSNYRYRMNFLWAPWSIACYL